MRNIKHPAFGCRKLVALAIILVLTLTGCGKNGDPLRPPTEPAEALVSIETKYGSLDFPKALYDKLRHTEVTDGSTAMETFYMIGAQGEKEIYRIYYADPQVGTLVGYLKTDSGEVSVSYTLCEYPEGTFADAEDQQLYHRMLDTFGVIMQSIHSDERFSETEHQEPVSDREVDLRYWKITLPENIQYTQTEEDGNYRVDFYAQVSGERIDLFMIGLGDLEAETTLGMYTVDGVQKPVVVKTYDLQGYDSWPQEEQITIHKMMEALNPIIQAIIEDENFG